jgi:sulfonate transport system permease protein
MKVAYQIGGLIAFAVVWQLVAAAAGNPGLVPPLGRVVRAFLVWAGTGLLVSDIAESIPRALLSLAIATPIGVALGLLFALAPPVRRAGEGVLNFLRSLPPVALLPLFVLWFGIDWTSKLLAAIFVCIFPVAVTTIQGALTADEQYAELGRDLRLSRLVYTTRILFPATAPAIIPGLRLSAGTAFIMLYVSELAGASSGLGYRISIAQLSFQADLMIAGLLVLGGAALVTDLSIVLLARATLHYAGKS